MNCPNCGRTNPDDRDFCYSCQAELPKPKPKKQSRRNFLGFPMWMWVALVLFFVATSFGQCFITGVPGQ
jgi:predicted nucleic acid-binding Zn ribbon protein